MKKRVEEAMTWAQDQLRSLRGRTAMRLGVLVVFINQMLLMMAGDVEPNPGPGEGEGRDEIIIIILWPHIHRGR